MENDNKKEMALEDLATIIQNDLLGLKTDVRDIKNDVQELKSDVAEIKSTVNNIEAELNKKVDKVDHNTLTYRVEKLEKKFA